MSEPSEPRYRRIVAELRERIATGELASGDRVPSTREITRGWGVAMATATRVLTELRHEGLVRAVPGVGTVVAGASRPARPIRPATGGSAAVPAKHAPPSADRPGRRSDTVTHPALTLARIVTAAVTVATAEGLTAVSMRRVAAELGVATMSLYRHVSDKDDLLTHMMDAVIAQSPLPARKPDHWRAAVELAARHLWDLFRRHPWLAPALSVTRPQLITSALPYSEWVFAALSEHGFDPQSAFTAHLVLLNHTRGVAVHLEAEREAEAHSGLDNEEWLNTQEPAFTTVLASGCFPALSRLTETGYDFDLDTLFEFGLQRLLDGLAQPTSARRNTPSMTGIDTRLAQVRATLDRLDPHQAHIAVTEGALFVDTRPEARRREEGGIPGALVIERNHLEWRCDPTSDGALPEATTTDVRWIVFCDEGYASSLAAASLRGIGLPRATDLVGGFRAWRAAGLPVTEPTNAR